MQKYWKIFTLHSIANVLYGNRTKFALLMNRHSLLFLKTDDILADLSLLSKLNEQTL